MPIRVQIAGKGVVEFPDGTTEDVMRKALSSLQEWKPESPSAAEMLTHTGRMAPPDDEHEPETWTGGFIRGLRREFVDPLLSSTMAKSAANPQTAGDIGGLLLPSAIGMGSAREFIPAAKRLYEGAAQGAAEKEGLKKLPAVVKGMWKVATQPTADQNIAAFERKLYQSGHVAPDVASVPDGGVPQGDLPAGNSVDVESAQDALARNSSKQPTPPPDDETVAQAAGRIWREGKKTPQTPPVQTDRVPYGGSSPAVPAEPVGTVTGKAPTLEDSLRSMLEEQMGKGEPAQSSTLPETGDVAGAQKGKVGKRPGGYTTDLPPVSETRYNELQQKLGGTGGAPVDPELHLNDEMLSQLIDQFGGRETRGATGIPDSEIERLRPSPRGQPQSARQRIENAAITAQGDRGSVEHPESISDVLNRMYEQLAKEKP